MDVAPEVYPLLLREGYSSVFGARPLKRTVERLVLLPVARAIAADLTPRKIRVNVVAPGATKTRRGVNGQFGWGLVLDGGAECRV